ncbi:MAG: hypothetical protein PWQ25_338 [Deferribacteres bacterium]|jgi:hypothetical protein|nr:hypothetical protein [Deferribacteres bacterium]
MKPEAIPRKIVELNSLKTTDIKLRRLFILIDGKKSVEELAFLSHMDLSECYEKLNQLKNLGAVEGVFDESENQGDILNEHTIECSDFYDCLAKSLSLFIGPVALVIVEQKVPKKDTMSTYEMHTIIEKISFEIEKTDDRKKFIELMKGKVSKKI